MSRARAVAAASAGLLVLGNLLTAIFDIDGTTWFALRSVLAGILVVALAVVVWIWASRRRHQQA